MPKVRNQDGQFRECAGPMGVNKGTGGHVATGQRKGTYGLGGQQRQKVASRNRR
jgi:hypothetical protein